MKCVQIIIEPKISWVTCQFKIHEIDIVRLGTLNLNFGYLEFLGNKMSRLKQIF